ncbi:uncharacterized protein LOC120484139 [Pimephales promelas]|uniref:uncharacterized protein LOC120484139 n=1 Tax=Pimephales promelas TaxID=90988 RepID=UPI001955591B|nr:uncharacterized protein LOC120484139 [Pimephales promelas]
MFGNVQSLRNKADELRACSQYLTEYRQSCLICLTESWLTEADPDSSVDLEGYTLVRMDRNQNSGKRKGGVEQSEAITAVKEMKGTGIHISINEVKSHFRRINSRKACGPDGISCRTLKKQHGRGELIWQKSCCIVYSEFCDARHGGIGHLMVQEWHCAMCAWWNGWTEMEWGKEEEAQLEVVKGHAPWLQQSSPGLRRCAREAAATSPSGQGMAFTLRRIPDSSRSSISNPVCWSCRNWWSSGLAMMPRRVVGLDLDGCAVPSSDGPCGSRGQGLSDH